MNWITTTLPANGYTVLQGTATAAFPGCTIFIAAFGSCFGNNTATPTSSPSCPSRPGCLSTAG